MKYNKFAYFTNNTSGPFRIGCEGYPIRYRYFRYLFDDAFNVVPQKGGNMIGN